MLFTFILNVAIDRMIVFFQEGNGLADLVTSKEAEETMKNVGFELIDAVDCAHMSEIPWYSMLQPRWTLADFRSDSY